MPVVYRKALMNSMTGQVNMRRVARQAVARLRDIVHAGGFERFAAVDPQTGETDPQARALFASPPNVTLLTSAQELI
ncbi:MAG: hypothetical protein R3C68_15780 [Myxococcota bacterium]